MPAAISLVGVPTDFGTNRRGVDMGPSAIRYAGIRESFAAVDVSVSDVGDVRPSATTGSTSGIEPIAQVESVAALVARTVGQESTAGRLPVVLGGDHSVALGTLQGLGTDRDIGVIWFDAHADFNIPATSPSGHVHGMVLAAALGIGPFGAPDGPRVPGLSAENVVLVGLRDVDPEERPLVRESDATAFTMSDIDGEGIDEICARAIEIAADGTDGVHVSLDMDFLDPIEAPGVGTPVRGGATYREAHLAMEIVSERLTDPGRLAGFDVVEVNPIRDRENQTAELAVELVTSAFGKRTI